MTIDGVLSESVWKTAGSGGFTQRDPLDGQPATEPTTVWVAFDKKYLYVAARAQGRQWATSGNFPGLLQRYRLFLCGSSKGGSTGRRRHHKGLGRLTRGTDYRDGRQGPAGRHDV
jgi:hypothetical protein